MFFDTYFLRPPFDTTSRGHGRTTGLRLASHSGNLTPPRISPSCPHCLSLWLGRGIIVGGRGHGAACQSRCGSNGLYARFLKGRLFMQKSAQEGLGASARRCPFRGPSAKVIQLPDMKLSKNNGEAFQLPSHFLIAPKIFGCKGKRSNFFAPLHPTTDKLSANHNPLSEKIF